ncbi:MAG TPA: capsule assembly Wzi family protein [Acidobacteriaceae bacterium]|nr:capsule assembly Wzi family protein [Acidobacteriaceae bacterium]
MKNRGIRAVLRDLLSIGLTAAAAASFTAHLTAQTQKSSGANQALSSDPSLPITGDLAQQPTRFLAALDWRQTTQQDQSLPAYRQPAPQNPQTEAAPYSLPAPQRNEMDEALPPYRIVDTSALGPNLGSTYIPVDSWIYPALMRLYSLGYLNRAFVDMRPWTRVSVLRMLYAEQERIHMERSNEEALKIWEAVMAELEPDVADAGGWHVHTNLESLYERAMGIAGTPLNDSYHLGQTIINNYGRPYAEGFNNYMGFSARATSGPFGLYVRGEYQHAPSADGYPPLLAQTLANIDEVPNTPQDTIPAGPIDSQNYFRLVEANLSATLLNHAFSIGKSDVWDGPAMGGAFDWSNNAENIYSFRINRVEPLHIPLLSILLGPIRYEFLVGKLEGHTVPMDPWVHMEKFAFNPTPNFEFGFSRTIIWGGKGHAPITFGSFWHSFISFQNVSAEEKFSRNDPGARFSTFDFTYRLPFARRWLTLYTDSEAHDDVTPVSAPRRAGIRAGLYLTRIPGAPKFDLRTEAVYTDVPVRNSVNGSFMYIEAVQRQGYTNKGNIFGDWIGRESKGGQAWLTYHLSGNEMVQVSYRNAKAAKDFIPGGTTQNLFAVSATKRLRPQLELNGFLQYERWSAPVYKTGPQNDFTTNVQVTWYPQLKNILRSW